MRNCPVSKCDLHMGIFLNRRYLSLESDCHFIWHKNDGWQPVYRRVIQCIICHIQCSRVPFKWETKCNVQLNALLEKYLNEIFNVHLNHCILHFTFFNFTAKVWLSDLRHLLSIWRKFNHLNWIEFQNLRTEWNDSYEFFLFFKFEIFVVFTWFSKTRTVRNQVLIKKFRKQSLLIPL